MRKAEAEVGPSISVQVLGPEANQEDVYEAAVRPIVEDVMRGYNGTIMAYGQACSDSCGRHAQSASWES
jgi:hypothetical protein